MSHNSIVLWFTGLSGAGKTTIAQNLAQKLEAEGKSVRILDGDVIREELNTHLSFSPEDIKENNRLVSQLCCKESEKYDYVLVPIISPFRESRKAAREVIGEAFRLVYIRITKDEAIARDPKGLYKKALNGEIENFIGVDPNVPYEEPLDADLVLDTCEECPEDCINKLSAYIEKENEKVLNESSK